MEKHSCVKYLGEKSADWGSKKMLEIENYMKNLSGKKLK